MTTKVTITGSGCPIPDAHRAGPGVLVEHDGLSILIDAGRSTVQRLAGAQVWPPDLGVVLVTHHHSDHLIGLQDVVHTRWVMDRTRSATPLPVVVPAGPSADFVNEMMHPWRHDHTRWVMDRTRSATPLPVVVPAGPSADFVNEMMHPWRHDLAVRSEHTGRPVDVATELIAFDLPDEPAEVWCKDNVVVLAGPVHHEPVHPAVGYRIETPDGVVAISGDTIVCDEVAALAQGADVLVYEAMRFALIEALPKHRRFILDYHADTRLIGAQARDLAIPTLVLTHLIPPPDTEAEVAGFVADVRDAGYEGDVIVANDLDAVTIG